MEVTPNENDVLLGRGHFVNKYPGNQRFRDIVEEQKPNYIAAVKRKDKRNIAIGIINAIQSSNPPGRFLVDSKDSKISILSDGAWEVASPEKALQKVLHRLRENKAKGENEGMTIKGGEEGEGEGLEEARLEQQNVRSSVVESVHPRVDMPTTVETKVNQGSLELLTSVSISWSTALQQRNSQLDYSSQIQQPEFSVAIERPNVESILDQKESASGIKCKIEPRSYGVTSICEHSEGTNPKANKISMKLHSGINELNNFGQAQQYLSISGSGKHETFESQREKASFSREEWNSMPPLLGVAPMGGPSETRKPKAKDTGNNYWLMKLHSKINQLGYNGPDQQQQNFLGSGNIMAKTVLHGKATFPFDESNVHPQIVASTSIFPSGSLKTGVNDSDYVNFDSAKVETKAINQLYVNNDSQEFDHIEYSLRQWIDESKLRTKFDALDSADDRKRALSGYITSALLVASKITESLVKADKMEQSGCQNIVPLASIAAENIDLGLKNGRRSLTRSDQTKSPHQVLKRGDIQRNESRLNLRDNSQTNHLGTIDYVRMNCPSGNLSDVGNKTDRLFALGVVFVEIFAFGNPTFDAHAIYEIKASANAKSSGDTKTKPTFESTNNVPLKKRRSDQEQDNSSEISGKLALLGTPRPLCALVEDLLECIRGEFRRDDAYKSFEEVYLDLQLMITEPSKYLLDNHVPQLMISDKLYGRDDEMLKIQEAYKLRSTRDCLGVVITGEASVGKSRLARSIDELSWRNNGTVLEGKFDQIQESQPLSVIANIFNDMCRFFAESVRSQGMKQNVASALKSALGSQAGLLARFLPNLPRLMTLNSIQNSSSFCSESTQAIRLLFCKTLQVLSFYSSGTITILLDDLQWADPASLLLISSLLQSSIDNKSVFFIFCIRDNECQHSPDSTVNTWYQSTFEMPMEHITLANLSEDGVNAMVSDTLCLFPRLTRPLSRVLHRKALGNPSFVWQTLKVLQKEGYLYHSLRGTMRRWMWDMDKIGELPLSENVLHLLIRQMDKLPSDLKMGLEVASCIGATVSMTVLGILSSHLKVDLVGILERVAEKGFMDRVGTEKYRFVHDRVQQEAYEMMTEHRRSERHTTFGLAIYSQACSNNDDDLLCISVNQINRAGPGTITDFRQKAMIAALNLKVGRRSTALKDFAYAYFCFKNGISFLNEEYWKHQYRLSIDLHDAAAAAACALGSVGDVQKYSLSVLSHATSLEDKLNAMLAIVKSLRKSLALQEAKQWGVKFLQELGEEPCRIAGDPQLNSDISSMIKLIGDIADDSILNLKQSNDEKLVGIMKLYHEYFYIFQMVEPGMLFSVSHRMVQLSFERGLNEISPLAFAQFGVTALCMGNACEGYRMGSLALKLARNLGVPGLVSSIIAIVQPYVAWVSEPFRNIADSHQLGHTLGKQCGDESSSNLNNSWLELTNFLTGQDLTTISSEMHSIMREHRKNHTWCTYCLAFTYYLSVALIEGPDFRDSVGASDIPRACDIIAFAKSRKYEIMSLNMQANQMIRSFLFRQYDEILKAPGILSRLLGNKIPLFSLFIVGVFYEGLASFCMARRLQDDIWITKGNAALAFIQHWSNLAPRNFENKLLLLEAEKYFTFGDSYKAQKCYEDAIRSAQTQQFIHEEAISHELVGLFYLDKGQHDNSRQSLSRSIGCFKLWGASAVAERLSSFIHDNFETCNLEGDTK